MIIFIHHSVNPYRVAFFNRLAEKELDFKVYFLSKPAKNRKWQVDDYKLDFPHIFLDGPKVYLPGNDHSYFQFNNGLIKQLDVDSPSAIISIAWNHLAAFQAAWYAGQKTQIKYIIWSVSTKYESGYLRWLTKPLVKWLIQNCDGYLAGGSRAKDYLISLGAKRNKTEIAYNTVDQRFHKKILEKTLANKGQLDLRKILNIAKDDTLILYVGQLIKRKGIDVILESAYELQNSNYHFLLVGYGSLQKKVSELIESGQLKNTSHIPFVPNENLMHYYAAADLFLLASFEEAWGLVVNEAMIAGNAVLVSKYAGCSADLVQNGRNGHTFDPHRPNELVKLIKKFDRNKAQKMGLESQKIIEKVNIEQNIQALEKILK